MPGANTSRLFPKSSYVAKLMLFSKKTHDRKIRSRAFPNAGRKRQNGKKPTKPVLDFQSATHATPRHGPNEFDSAPGPQSVFTKPENPKPAGTDPPPSLFPRSEPIGFPTPATENRRRQSRKSEPSGKQRRYGNGSVPSSFIKRPSSGTGFLISGRSSFRRSAE